MASMLKIGSIFGISIELDWIFIFITIAFFILSPEFGLIWALLFVCALIHELAHSVTAMRNGLKVKKIILIPFGGASIIENIELDPRVEFNTALVGPLTSLVLGGLFGILAIFTPLGGLTFFVNIMFILNISLGVLNLLPAFPMDGGRVFRGYISRKYDRYKATESTIKISKIMYVLIFIATVAYVIIVKASFLAKELDIFLMVVFIWFLYGGVVAEEYGMKIRKATRGLSLKGAITKHFAIVKEDAPIKSLYKLVSDTKSHIIITRKGKDYSIVDISKIQKTGPNSPVGSIAIPIPSIKKSESAADAFYKMENDDTAIAAVVSKDRLLGVMTFQQLQTLISLHMIKSERRGGTGKFWKLSKGIG